MYAWLTPDSQPSDDTCLCIRIPNGEGWIGAVRGALLLLTESENWQQLGSTSPEDVAALFYERWLESIEGYKCMPVGTIILGGWSDAPDGFLLCNGSVYLKTQYPELYAVIGEKFGGSGFFFAVPDFDARFPIVSGVGYEIGAMGGLSSVTLTENQIPSHNHTMPGTVTTLNELPIGTTPVLSPSLVQQNTGNSGGNQSHTNIPPYLVVNAAIRYRP